MTQGGARGSPPLPWAILSRPYRALKMKQQRPAAALLKKFLPVQASAHANTNLFRLQSIWPFVASGRPRFDEGTRIRLHQTHQPVGDDEPAIGLRQRQT